MSDCLPPQQPTTSCSRRLRFAGMVVVGAVCFACATSASSGAAASSVSHAGPTPTSRHARCEERRSNEQRGAPAELPVSSSPLVLQATAPALATVSPLSVEQSVAQGPVAPTDHIARQYPTAPSSAAVIQSILRSHQGVIRRRCWVPMQERRGNATTSTARVTLTLVIAPTGTVESVRNTVGAPSYPGLGHCIANLVRTWSFPPASDVNETTLSFVFAEQ